MINGALLPRLDALARRGSAGLAWEVLRRNAGYLEYFAKADRARVRACQGPENMRVVSCADWGLHFR